MMLSSPPHLEHLIIITSSMSRGHHHRSVVIDSYLVRGCFGVTMSMLLEGWAFYRSSLCETKQTSDYQAPLRCDGKIAYLFSFFPRRNQCSESQDLCEAVSVCVCVCVCV